MPDRVALLRGPVDDCHKKFTSIAHDSEVVVPAAGVGMEMHATDAGANTVRVGLRGRLDTPGVDAVETRLTAMLVPGGHSAIVDLSGVEFVGSMGIRMFVAIAKALARKGQRLVLFAPQPPVAQMFEMVSIGDVIQIAEDESAALARAHE